MSDTSLPRQPGLPDVPEFSLTAELPKNQTLVLEASAGTGKTYTIASLAARYLAEGVVRLEDLMVVTFGRMATQELRDRVRDRLITLERALASGIDDGDPVAELLLATDPDEVVRRRARLTAALASFDEATIATTHSFCQRMLSRLGVAADAEPGTDLLEDPLELIEQIIGDVYLRRFAAVPISERPFDLVAAQAFSREATQTVQAQLVPTDAPADSAAAARVQFAAEVRAEFELRKRQAGLHDFDDLQDRLAQALKNPISGQAAKRTLRAAYQVVLVDEFQDTDPVQWQILQLAFHGHRTLILIGDPKQAIYAFRGADVYTYLQAARAADQMQTLGTNWRSDARLVRGLSHLWTNLTLGHPDIPVREVAAQHATSRLTVPGQNAPIRIRQLLRTHADQSATGYVVSGSALGAVAADVASEVVALLASGARIDDDRPLQPSDIAVLVNTNNQGELVRDALRSKGVPVVLAGNTSVFSSAAAREWQTLLEALEAPNRSARIRAAALTPFIGWTASRLAAADVSDIDGLIDRLRRWANALRAGGMAALLEAVTVDGELGARVLAGVDGDRHLTDLRHVAHALNTVARTEHLGPAALLEWLRRRIVLGDAAPADELSRRLASEAAAVQVYTVHKSKGLEFGVVLVPFAWNCWVPDPEHISALRLHDAAGNAVLDVGGPGTDGYGDRLAAHRTEDFGEDLRELYVAFTRARSLLVAWWAPGWNAKCAPLSRVLLATPDSNGELPVEVAVPDDADFARRIDELAAATGGLIAIEPADPLRDKVFVAEPRTQPELRLRTFDRTLDRLWRRTSYSSLTAAAHAAHYGTDHSAGGLPPESGDAVDLALRPAATGSEPEDPGLVDEPTVDSVDVVTAGTVAVDAEQQGILRAVASPLEDFPGGTAFGTVVHEVLEYLDTSAADLPAELLAHCERVVGGPAGRGGAGELAADRLAAALGPVCATPLGVAANNLTLADIKPADRLAEMAFELPLAGGDQPHDGKAVGDLADVLARHLPDDDLLADYPAMVRHHLLAGQALRGYLTGSIDAVLRIIDADGTPRFVVVDYKTNRLGVPGEPLSAWDYRPAAMATAMMGAHYPLQALLYQVALHRYLLWRLPNYQPDQHLGGSLYLFVRGMSGPGTPVVDGMPCGVFTWQPSSALVIEASEVLAG